MKIIKKIIQIALALFVPATVILFIGYFIYISIWQYSVNFDGYENEFNAVKELVINSVVSSEEIFDIHCQNDENMHDLYSLSTKEYLDAPKNVRNSIKILCYNVFNGDSHLEVIKYENSTVIFRNQHGNYAVVYSPNQKPSGVLGNNSDRHEYCKKINKDWYHVTLY